MSALATAGERLWLESDLPWVSDLIAEGAAAALDASETRDASLVVHVERERRPFAVDGWEFVARGVRRRGTEAVIENACTSGFDVHVRCFEGRAKLAYRWRPPARERTAARLLRSRFHLLARSVLLQYPALWWASVRDRAPLHASAIAFGDSTPLVTAQSGIGRSTLVLDEIARGAHATGDNIGVGDGTTFWGLVEPARVSGGTGRRMPHGRNEVSLPKRAESLVPTCVVILARGNGDTASISRCTRDAATRALVTSTYMAGELRRFWGFAAALAAATGVGPAHAPVTSVAARFAAQVPCFTLALGPKHDASLARALESMEVAA